VIAASIAFLLLKSIPGDEFSHLLENPNISADELARLREHFGPNEPLAAQYWHWLSRALQGDLQSASSFGHRPVAQVIGEHLPNTLQLMTLAFLTSMAAGIALGAWQGTHTGSRGERVSSGLTLGLFSIPDFWLALILLLVFALVLQWFPAQGMRSPGGDGSWISTIGDRLHHIFLPWLSLTLVDIAVISRYQRAAMRDVLAHQFLRTARAKGVPESSIMWRHALRVAVLPTITIAGLYFPALFVGAVLIEKVFSWPGIGLVLTQAIAARDYFLVAGIVVV
jgi:peptide/nickel transport system permease protein